MSDRLIQALQQPDVFPHPVQHFEIIETHLSWVILTGPFAYKIKKAVNLGFQDFTTLEKRKHFCEKEITLNQRLAPSLYDSVVPITGTENSPSLTKTGPVIEYAVKMHQFSQTGLLSRWGEKHSLSLSMIDDLASQLALFHQKAEQCPLNFSYGSPENVFAPMQANFDTLRTLKAANAYHEHISRIEKWTQNKLTELRTVIEKRKQAGWVRACHGDLHLGNIVLVDQKPLIFDCIEFNEPFRWIDVMNDLGFLQMDLDRYSASDLGHYLINRYCERTLDYEGLLLLRFYQCYRAMVRAKITAFQLEIPHTAEQKEKLQQDLKQFFDLAERYTQPLCASLTITCGVSGSGKTYESQKLLMKSGAIRLRSDVFRLSLFSNKKERYTQAATQKVYQTLLEQAEMLLHAGYPVIIDAACLKREQRELFFDLAQKLQITFHILALDAPSALLYERIQQRANDPSEATIEIVDKQIKEQDPLSEDEKKYLL